MSRLGRKPLQIPEKVKVEFKDNVIEVSGPLGKITQPVKDGLTIKTDGKEILIEKKAETTENDMMQGLIRGLIKNAIVGVTEGFKKILEIQGLGYKAALEGKQLILQLGYSHPVHMSIPDGIKIVIEKNTLLTVSGVDKNLVGDIAAQIRAVKTPEPYKGTGVRYQGEHIIRKAGKAVVGGAGGKK